MMILRITKNCGKLPLAKTFIKYNYGVERFTDLFVSSDKSSLRDELRIGEFENLIHMNFYETGTTRENIKLSILDKRVLIIDASKSTKPDLKKEKEGASGKNIDNPLIWRYGPMVRSVRLPTDSDTNFMRARYQDGILWISVPRIENYIPEKADIEIE